VNKETIDEVSFGLDLVHLAVKLGSFESPVVPAEVEALKIALRQAAMRKHDSEPKE
jgi:hypothetical protein